MSKEHKPMTPGMKLFFGHILPLIFILVGIVVGYFGYKNVVLANASKSWDSAPGIITASSVTKTHHASSSSSSSSSSYQADIEYKFMIGERPYLGHRVAYGIGGNSKRSRIQSIVNRYPIGAKVSVYYLARDPNQSLLEPGIKFQTLISPLIGLVFLGLGIVMLIFLPKSYAKK